MVVGVRDDDVLIHAKTEAVWRVEVAIAGTQLTKLAPVR